MAKVFIGVGHGGSDPGAVGYIKEADVNLTMALACKEVLEAHGVAVKMSRYKDENDGLNEEIKECNAYAPDLAVEVHNNAGGGDGFEVFHSIGGGKGKTLAVNIEAEVKAIGQNSRGVKTRKGSSGKDYYGFIRSTNCPAVICEGVFVDNATDAKIADTLAEQKAFGVAYAKGVLKTLGIAYNGENKAQSDEKATEDKDTFKEFKVRVNIDHLNVRKGAGTNYGIVQKCPVGVFTITEVKGSWGKLKSGLGWISLNYTQKL
jgi:N-acetylmuramoyl-L-alanine amidase